MEPAAEAPMEPVVQVPAAKPLLQAQAKTAPKAKPPPAAPKLKTILKAKATSAPQPSVGEAPTAVKAGAGKRGLDPSAPTAVKAGPTVSKQELSEFARTMGPAPPVTTGPATNLTRAALRARFLRSIPGKRVDPRSVEMGVAGTGVQKLEYCPADILQKMTTKADEEYWLQVWASQGCTWGNVKMYIKKTFERVEQEHVDWDWHTFGQMEKHYGCPSMATKMKGVCLKVRGRWRWHPDLPGDEEAMQFWISLKDGSSQTKKRKASYGADAEANVSADSALPMMSMYSLSNKTMADGPLALDHNMSQPNQPAASRVPLEDRPSTRPIPEPEVTGAIPEAEKELEEEKMKAAEEDIQKKNDRREKLEATRKQLEKCPHHQATKWLTGLQKMLNELEGCLQKAATAAKDADCKLPANTAATYNTTFTEAKKKILQFRSSLEANMSNKTKLKKLMADAKTAVETTKRDMKAFQLLWRGYYKEKK